MQITVDSGRISKTFDTQKEGLTWIRKINGQIDDGLNFASTKMTISDHMKDWLATKRTTTKRNTYVKYEQINRCYITPFLGKVIIRYLRSEQIQAHYQMLLDKGIGVYTVRKVHEVLNSALNQATRTGMISRNPARYAQPPQEPVDEMAIFNEDQASQFQIAAQGHRWEALYHMALLTGMRQMELLGLFWTDIDWNRQTLKIERQLCRPNGNGIEFSSLKTKYGRRTIDLGKKPIETLHSHFERQKAESVAAGDKWMETGLIITNIFGRPIDHCNLDEDFKLLLKKAGLPKIRFHDLRHTNASLMLNTNTPLIHASRRLGHAKPSITLDVYGHLIPSSQTGIVDRITDLVLPVVVEMNKKDVNV